MLTVFDQIKLRGIDALLHDESFRQNYMERSEPGTVLSYVCVYLFIYFIFLFFLFIFRMRKVPTSVLPPSLAILNYSYRDIPQSQRLNSGMPLSIRISQSPSKPSRISVI